MAAPLRVMASRHSAFYSPLLCTLAAGFLEREGLSASYAVLPPGGRSAELIGSGAVDIMQSAVSSNWQGAERGEAPLPVHFAQINRRDGFFLVARRTDGGPFTWRELEGRELLADHAAQPLAMLRYAVFCNQTAWEKIRVVDAGDPAAMEAVFRSGRGDFVHLQSPAAHQLQLEGVGRVAVSVGLGMPPVAFSSLCGSRDFAASETCAAFLRAYAAARQWVRETPADEVAAVESQLFPGVALPALATAISAYQDLGCWEGGIAIPRDLYSQALTVFLHAGVITRRHLYDDVCVAG